MKTLQKYFGWPDVVLGVVVALSLTYCTGSPGVVKPESKYLASLEEGIDFSRPGSPKFIKKFIGLAGREDWGRWSDQDVVIIEFQNPLPSSFTLELQAKAFGSSIDNPTKIVIGGASIPIQLKANIETFLIPIRVSTQTRRIEIYPVSPVSPNSLDSQNPDHRRLGVGLKVLKISNS